MVAHAFNPCTGGGSRGRWISDLGANLVYTEWIPKQTGLHRGTLSQNLLPHKKTLKDISLLCYQNINEHNF